MMMTNFILLSLLTVLTNSMARIQCGIHKGSPIIPILSRNTPIPRIDIEFPVALCINILLTLLIVIKNNLYL